MGDCADGISGTGSKPGMLKAGVGRGGLTPAARCSTPPAGWRRRPACLCYHHDLTAGGGAILDLLASCGVPPALG